MIPGKRVQLRPVEESDYPLIQVWMNNPEVWRYMDYERAYSLADVQDDIEGARRSGQPFTILVDGRPIGRIGLNQFRARDRICGFYMYVGEPAYWGQGHGRDAAMTLIGYAFDRWDLHQIELWTLADNVRAIPLYRSCGFVEEARLRERSFKEGTWIDHVVMSVNRGEFERARQAWTEGAPESAGLRPGFVTQD